MLKLRLNFDYLAKSQRNRPSSDIIEKSVDQWPSNVTCVFVLMLPRWARRSTSRISWGLTPWRRTHTRTTWMGISPSTAMDTRRTWPNLKVLLFGDSLSNLQVWWWFLCFPAWLCDVQFSMSNRFEYYMF